MRKYGVFINYRRDKAPHLAGRIYDYLQYRGMDPFLDVYSLEQGDYRRDLPQKIRNTPYFLCVLTEGCMDDLDPDDPAGVYYQELETAVESGTDILMIAESSFVFPERLPPKIQCLATHNYYPLHRNMGNFFSVMEKLCETDIRLDKLKDVIDWREYAMVSANVFVTSREKLEGNVASWENRFGRELVASVREGRAFTGENMIQHINMSCYAASIIFAPERHMVDHRAYDHGMMFNIISTLLEDPDFSITLITNTPDCPSAEDACNTAKLGNSSLEDNQRAVFLSSVFGMERLSEEEPFCSARKSKRFRHLLTDTVLPFAYFQIIYKEPWSDFNHIKLDLYTEGLDSNSQRRSMLFFEKDHPDTYRFLQGQFYHLQERTARISRRLMQAGHASWQEEWNEYLEENNG